MYCDAGRGALSLSWRCVCSDFESRSFLVPGGITPSPTDGDSNDGHVLPRTSHNRSIETELLLIDTCSLRMLSMMVQDNCYIAAVKGLE